jgi:hypothetical protein
MARSVTTSMSVDVPASVMVITTAAPAVPFPRLSLPLASTTIRCAASSFSVNVPVPL